MKNEKNDRNRPRKPAEMSLGQQEAIARSFGRVRGNIDLLLQQIPEHRRELGLELQRLHDNTAALFRGFKPSKPVKSSEEADNTPHPLDAVERLAWLQSSADGKQLTDAEIQSEIERFKRLDTMQALFADMNQFDSWLRRKGIPALSGLEPLEFIRYGRAEFIETIAFQLATGMHSWPGIGPEMFPPRF